MYYHATAHNYRVLGANTPPHRHTHTLGTTKQEQSKKAVGETPQELQSSPRCLLVFQRVHSACIACPCAPQRTSIVSRRSSCVLLL